MSLKSILNLGLNLGTKHQMPNNAYKTKLTNIISLFSFVASALYTLNYLFILNQPMVAGINALLPLLT